MPSPPDHPRPSSVGSSDPAGRPGASVGDGADATVDRQLARLYGESVFGPWLDPADRMAAGRWQRKRASWTKRVGIVLGGILVIVAGAWLTLRGFSRQAAQERAQVAKDVAAFLAEGELERLSQFLAILSPASRPLQASDPYLDLIIQAEASLFRYHDASAARLTRIEPFLSAGATSPTRMLARLTVLSNTERMASYSALKALEPTLARDPELWTLLAGMEEERDVKAARASWERSFELGRLWLPHRYLQCAFEARRGRAEDRSRLASHMAKVAPESPWTHLALALRDGREPTDDGSPRPMPPVAQYYAQLAKVLASLRAGGSPAPRRQALGFALTAVQDSPAFVLDAFDSLWVAKARDLAFEMTSFESWPRSNAVARAKLDSFQASAEAPPPARAKPATTEPSDSSAASTKRGGAKVKKPGVAKKAAKTAKHGGRRRR